MGGGFLEMSKRNNSSDKSESKRKAKRPFETEIQNLLRQINKLAETNKKAVESIIIMLDQGIQKLKEDLSDIFDDLNKEFVSELTKDLKKLKENL